MGLSNILNMSTTAIISADELLAKKADGEVTVTGLEVKKSKGRDGNPSEKIIYHIKELGGLRVWASGGTMRKTIPDELIDEYGDLLAVNEALKKKGLRFRIGAMKNLQNGGKWRPIDCLGFEENGDGEV